MSEDIPFGLDPLKWTPRVLPVAKATATASQLAYLSDPTSSKDGFSLTLAHDPALLAQRTLLGKASMSGSDEGDSLSPAEREFAALVESRVNSCRICATTHGNASIRLGGDAEAVTKILEDGLEASIDDRLGGIAGFAAALAFTPPVVSEDEVSSLVDVGLTRRQMVDLVFAVAQFSWANRTMLPLGETSIPEKRT